MVNMITPEERKEILVKLFRALKHSPMFSAHTQQQIKEAAIKAEQQSYERYSTKEDYLRSISEKFVRINNVNELNYNTVASNNMNNINFKANNNFINKNNNFNTNMNINMNGNLSGSMNNCINNNLNVNMNSCMNGSMNGNINGNINNYTNGNMNVNINNGLNMNCINSSNINNFNNVPKFNSISSFGDSASVYKGNVNMGNQFCKPQQPSMLSKSQKNSVFFNFPSQEKKIPQTYNKNERDIKNSYFMNFATKNTPTPQQFDNRNNLCNFKPVDHISSIKDKTCLDSSNYHIYNGVCNSYTLNHSQPTNNHHTHGNNLMGQPMANHINPINVGVSSGKMNYGNINVNTSTQAVTSNKSNINSVFNGYNQPINHSMNSFLNQPMNNSITQQTNMPVNINQQYLKSTKSQLFNNHFHASKKQPVVVNTVFSNKPTGHINTNSQYGSSNYVTPNKSQFAPQPVVDYDKNTAKCTSNTFRQINNKNRIRSVNQQPINELKRSLEHGNEIQSMNNKRIQRPFNETNLSPNLRAVQNLHADYNAQPVRKGLTQTHPTPTRQVNLTETKASFASNLSSDKQLSLSNEEKNALKEKLKSHELRLEKMEIIAEKFHKKFPESEIYKNYITIRKLIDDQTEQLKKDVYYLRSESVDVLMDQLKETIEEFNLDLLKFNKSKDDDEEINYGKCLRNAIDAFICRKQMNSNFVLCLGSKDD